MAYSATAAPALQDERVRMALMLLTTVPLNWTTPTRDLGRSPLGPAKDREEAEKLLMAAGWIGGSFVNTVTLSALPTEAAQAAAASLARDWAQLPQIRVVRADGTAPPAPALLSVTAWTTPR